jgi:hypothetical protein
MADSEGGAIPRAEFDRPLAFLVDGDNATASLVPQMLAEAGRHGAVIIRRVYGDWASGRLASWKPAVQEHALLPIQQFANVAGKNATDSALIIDAMDILHSGEVRGFCIVSSDSDYTRLATRLREAGKFVLGIGRAATPAAFRNACNVFTSVENLGPRPVAAPEPAPGRRRPEPRAGARSAPPAARTRGSRAANEAVSILEQAFETVVEEDGRASLDLLGSALLKLDPAFDPRSFGRAKLSGLLEELEDVFRLERKDLGGHDAIFVRHVPRSPAAGPGPGPAAP